MDSKHFGEKCDPPPGIDPEQFSSFLFTHKYRLLVKGQY
ncbi:hypothetical protein M595_0102 [Lyngbya aestuarii BL J]|uniref:Uncharacterized protein n=1 Tax=Lyngbya aestuarii BL J TaxID=1348334 RepID=U7QRP3_9CYAN|nr:hypothetical protein M595_0102 [Lyngbya aestuarii BL J]